MVERPPQYIKRLGIKPSEFSTYPTERLEEIQITLYKRREHIKEVQHQASGLIHDEAYPFHASKTYPLLDGRKLLDPRMKPEIPQEFDETTRQEMLQAHRGDKVANLARLQKMAQKELFIVNGYLGPLTIEYRKRKTSLQKALHAREAAEQKLATALQKLTKYTDNPDIRRITQQLNNRPAPSQNVYEEQSPSYQQPEKKSSGAEEITEESIRKDEHLRRALAHIITTLYAANIITLPENLYSVNIDTRQVLRQLAAETIGLMPAMSDGRPYGYFQTLAALRGYVFRLFRQHEEGKLSQESQILFNDVLDYMAMAVNKPKNELDMHITPRFLRKQINHLFLGAFQIEKEEKKKHTSTS